jgi:hypothetical protein
VEWAAVSLQWPVTSSGASLNVLPAGLVGTLVQGMAFGTGSAIAHRAVDAVAGPRTVEHQWADGQAPAAAAGAQQQQQQQVPRCESQMSQFNEVSVAFCMLACTVVHRSGPLVVERAIGTGAHARGVQCMKTNGNMVSACQFFLDSLQQCQKS